MKKSRPIQNQRWSRIGVVKAFVCLAVCCLSLLTTSAIAQSQPRIDVAFKDASLTEVLNVLKQKTSYEYLYNDEEVKKINAITCTMQQATISEILTACLQGSGFGFKIEDNIIIITPNASSQSETVTVTGKVVDDKGKPVAGASVILKGSRVGMATNADGSFSLGVPRNSVIIISFLGMETQEIAVNAIRDLSKEQVFVLQPDATQVEEVVVTGYATIRKKAFTGSSITVSRDELQQVSKTNVLAALQTFDPSFRIVENNALGSDPNAIPELYIRGRSGIGLTELEKEGVSKTELLNNPNLPTFIMDGFQISVQKLYDMDPNRIESITILKDAAATAMYGSRAANGVVVITTVAPQAGKVTVNYNVTGTVTVPDLRDYNLMNAREKLNTELAAGVFTAMDESENQFELDRIYNAKLANVNRGVDTYWLSKPLRTAFNHKHSLYIDGGVDDLRFGVDLSYNNEDGVMKGSKRDRMAAGLYLDYRIKNFQIRNQTSYGITKSEESPYGSFSDYTSLLPYDEYRDENGNYLKALRNWSSSFATYDIPNPLYEATLGNYDRSKSYELINNLALNWYINSYWLLKGQFSITKTNGTSENFIDPRSLKNSNIQSTTNLVSGELSTSNSDSFSWDASATLSFNRLINKHNLNFLAGMNATSSNSHTTAMRYLGFPSGELSSPNYAQQMPEKPNVTQGMSRLFGLLGSFNYTYNDIYLADLSVRMDGSSEFGDDKRFAPFWSGGVGLNLHNYEFLRSSKVINLLKLRATYGVTGKVNFSPYDAQMMYQVINDAWYKTGFGATLIALGNRDLGWEKTRNLDVGVDVDLWQGLFQMNFSYYHKKTVDLVNSVTIPSSTGFTTYTDNVGEVLNKGFEIMLKSTIVNRKNTYVALFANFSHNKNTILKISNSMREYNRQVQAQYDDYNSALNRYKSEYGRVFLQYVEGGSLTSIFGMRSLGINPSDGREVFMRPDGSITYDWNAGDQVILGNTEPKGQGTFGVNARWKNFTLYTTFMYQFGGQQYNSTLLERVENARISSENVDKRVFTDRWQHVGDIAKYKKLESRSIETTRPTSRFVQDYNVLSFNSLTLGYEFDQKLLSKAHIGMLRLEIGANDIFRLSSVKQERGLDYPYARTMNFSVKLSF